MRMSDTDWKQHLDDARRRIGEVDAVIYLVHGTFANGAKWVDAASDFGQALNEKVQGAIAIVPVRWSGCNTFRARHVAARQLAGAIADITSAATEAGNDSLTQFVVGHSHGGNVATIATSSEATAASIDGAVTMGTPFIAVESRAFRPIIDLGTALFAALFAAWAVLFYSIYTGQNWCLWPWALLGGFSVATLLVGGMLLVEQMSKFARRITEIAPPGRLTREKLLVIRHQGDEASVVLNGARFAGWATDRLWALITSRLIASIDKLLGFMNYGNVRSTEKELRDQVMKRDEWFTERLEKGDSDQTVDSWMKSQPTYSQNKPWYQDSGFRDQIKMALINVAPALLGYLLNEAGTEARDFTMIIMGLLAAPAAVAVSLVVLGVPTAIISALSRIFCGWATPLAGPFLNLTVESTPLGTWTVASFEGSGQGSGLAHSKAYKDPAVMSYVADWINARMDAVRNSGR